MQLTCPEGVGPGDAISFTAADGRELTASVAAEDSFAVAIDPALTSGVDALQHEASVAIVAVCDLWDELQRRVAAQLPTTFPPRLLELMRSEADAEVHLLHKLTKDGHALLPPATNEEKHELFQLCATFLSKVGRNAPPPIAARVTSEIQRVKAAIDSAEMGRVSILFECLSSAHGLMGAAEHSTAIEHMTIAPAAEKAADYCLQTAL